MKTVNGNETVTALVGILSECDPKHIDSVKDELTNKGEMKMIEEAKDIELNEAQNKLARMIIAKNPEELGDRDVEEFGRELGEAIERLDDRS